MASTKQMIFLDTKHEGYGPDQCRTTMTVGELIRFLEDFDEDLPVYLRNDRGYTYGSILESDFEDSEYEDWED